MQFNRIIYFVASIFFSTKIIAQPTVQQLLNAQSIRSIGPSLMSGRVTGISVVNNNPQIMYVATASGGVWKSTSGGVSFSPIFDKQDVQNIGSIAVNQQNPDIVWAGTGEGNPRNSQNCGKGIYKSMDAGKNWVHMGLTETKTIHRIIIDPRNENIIYAAAMGSPFGPNEDRGVFKTEDGGISWKKILYNNNLTGCADLIIDPQNPNKLIAAMWEYQRKPYSFNSGGTGSGIYISIDAGKNWKKISDGIPEGNLGRIGLAIAPSKNNIVYAIIESKDGQAFFASNDGGNSFQKRANNNPTMGNRPFYYSEIYVHPLNENRVYSLWSQVAMSEDGGKNWSILLDWGHVHPDHHAFYIHPQNPNYMINGNDGGLNITQDGGNTWRFCEGIPVGQFYHVNYDMEIPYNVYGGLQDNGSWRGPAYTFTYGGIRKNEWQELCYGDGFDVVPLKNNSLKGYAMSQGGNVIYYNLQNAKSEFIKPIHPEGKYLRFNWNAAIAAHPALENALYYGSQYVHVSYNNGRSWKIISPDLTTNDTSKLHQEKSGGLTIDATHAENYCTIIAISPSIKDTNIIYISTDDGNLQLTKDAGKTWNNLTANIIGMPKNAWIPFIHINENNAAEIFIAVNNYRQNDWKTYFFKSSDFGKTWKNIADEKIMQGHALSIVVHPKENRLIFAGTDRGLYVSFDAGTTWNKWEKFPSCPVQDLKIHPRENDLIIGTFGRSVWIIDNIESLEKYCTDKLNTSFKIMSSSDGILANYAQPKGGRNGADEQFEGENKNSAVRVQFFIKGEKDVKTKKWKENKFIGKVYDEKNILIRTHKFNRDSGGIYTVFWRMIKDGIYYPTHGKTDAETMPDGTSVPPGKYKLVLQTGKEKDSVWVNVIADPREKFDMNSYQLKMQKIEEHNATVTRAFKSFEALKKAEKSIDIIVNSKYENDSAQSRLSKLAKPLRDSISAIKLLYMQANNVHFYEDVSVRLDELLNATNAYLHNEIYGTNLSIALQNEKIKMDYIAMRVNNFFEKQFASFQIEADKEKIKIWEKLQKY